MVLFPTLSFSLSLLSFPYAYGATIPKTTTKTTSVTLDGKTYVNKGLVAFGLIPSNFRESTGDTLGGIGSAITIKPGTYTPQGTSFAGTFIVHPDRGFNVNGTVDYQARQHEIDFVLTPYYDTAPLDFATAQQTLNLTYKSTILQYERNDTKTSGLDALAVRQAQTASVSDPLPDPEMPIPSLAENHLSLDVEGIVANEDGTFWISDEYGPYIYRFSSDGNLIQTIQPPAAILPRDSTGALNFTSASDPATGRAANKGFESLTIDRTTQTLYAMLQSALIQDGGSSKSTSRYTRLLAWNVSSPSQEPQLVGEWIIPLPQNSKGNTIESNEIILFSPSTFLILSRDSSGRGGDPGDTKSKYKHADLFSIKGASDIHGTKYDDPQHSILKNGKGQELDKGIVPAEYVSFVDFLDGDGLERFGLHNGDPDDQTLLDAKWESLALAPVNDPDFPDDFFLFTASDNDFISTSGVSLGLPFNAGLDVDNQFLVFRVTLPS